MSVLPSAFSLGVFMCRFIVERGTKETDGISVMTEGTTQTRLSLGRDREGGRLGHWLMPLMLAPWPFLRAFLFSWRRFLTLLLCHVHQPLVPRARGTRTPSGQTGTYLGSSLWTLPPPCRLGLPEHGPPGSALAANEPLSPAGTGVGLPHCGQERGRPV